MRIIFSINYQLLSVTDIIVGFDNKFFAMDMCTYTVNDNQCDALHDTFIYL